MGKSPPEEGKQAGVEKNQASKARHPGCEKPFGEGEAMNMV
jgi:hypothetical protein